MIEGWIKNFMAQTIDLSNMLLLLSILYHLIY